jgi:uncharacterized protein DUF4265
MVHITLPVFSDTGEEATRESLEVDEILPGQCRLLHSPALVDGSAKDDVIELDESLPCGFRLVSRGGNLAAVVVFEKPEVKQCAETLHLIEKMQLVGGMAEGGPERMLVFSIPVSAGFPVVEGLLDEFVRTLPGTTWWYCNVHEMGDPKKPLDWWTRQK